MIISGHEVNSSNHPIEFNEDDCRVLNGVIQIQESRAKQRLRYCVDQNYKEEHTSKDQNGSKLPKAAEKKRGNFIFIRSEPSFTALSPFSRD